MTVRLKTPSDTIERRDLTAALTAYGFGDVDEFLNIVAIVQELDENEVLKQAGQLKAEDLGSHITVVSGQQIDKAGFMTDLNAEMLSARMDSPKLVLDGKRVDLIGRDYVVVTPATSTRDNSDLLQG